MFKLDSAAHLLDTFRPKDRRSVELSPDFTFPLVVKDYVAWKHPAGGRVFLVFAVPGGVPTGIAFDSNGGGSAAVPAMCSWCHCTAPGTGIGLLTATLNGSKRVGAIICEDLSCRDKLEEAANRTGGSVRPAMEKLVARMGKFASDALRIDLSGAGR
ncbi:MAG: FBP domain-containing protein [Myxococcaceae bacterium]|nr:FBP domain-containing protein [Myxococcaceae bacterium]